MGVVTAVVAGASGFADMVVLPVGAERVSDTALPPGAGWALGDSGAVRSFSGVPALRG
ncbi:alpha-glucosidase [Nocardia seriolae]|uniref:Alpha-glucosidase n=1 Tax=Nocardia seriolae TaxID=37332 RepID=A0ABC9YNU1_9NOCA|nr:alpha-glucosidase [Nocardia seriolae]GAP26756.1 alpha-glucosidase [Nocardia seriolae]